MFNEIQRNFMSPLNSTLAEQDSKVKDISETPSYLVSIPAANQEKTPKLAQRTVEPVNVNLADIINQKIENEINNSPLCSIYYIDDKACDLKKVRFTEVAKNNMYKEGISLEKIENAIKISDGKCNIEDGEDYDYDRYYYVEDLDINHYLNKFIESNHPYNLRAISNVFEGYNERNKKWERTSQITGSREFNEIMVNHKYIEIQNISEHDWNGGNRPIMSVNKYKFIADRTAYYFSEAFNIVKQELSSDKQPEEKVKNLQDMLSSEFLIK